MCDYLYNDTYICFLCELARKVFWDDFCGMYYTVYCTYFYETYKGEGSIRIPYYQYCFCLWGSCLGGYQLPYYDKFTHFASGVVICEMIYLLYKHYLRDDHRKSLMFIFLNAVNASVALLWEFYEYALLVFFQYDAIKHFSTGVHDTITDMLVAVIGGLILSIYLIHYDQSGKNHFFVSLERKIYKMNH